MSNVFVKKKRMTEKMMTLSREYAKIHEHGIHPKGFILNYSNKCNFTCPHCYTRSGAGEFGETKLTLEDIKRLADDADKLGVYEIDIQGGEPLLNPQLFDILEAINTERFYVYITTNGWFLDQDMAEKLSVAGVDRVSVSIDAFNPDEHDKFRKKEGSFQRCIEALGYVKNAGMKAYVNIVVGHYNAQSEELKKFLNYSDKNEWGVVFNCASPTGNWKGNYEVMLTEEDSRVLENLKKEHPSIIRDLWNYFNPTDKLVYGCPAVNLFYVNPLGDILPCPYIHTKLGNIKDESLKTILQRGFGVKEFREYSSKCLVGENIDFAKKYLDKDMSILKPIPLNELFHTKQQTRLDEFSKDLGKTPMTEAFISQIDILKSRYGNEYVDIAESILELFDKMKIDANKIARKYIYDYLKQLDFFIKNKNYGHTDFNQIYDDIYNNEKTMMETYMPGLLLSYAYTTILYEKNHLFIKEFLPQLKENMRGIEIGFGEGFYLWEILKMRKNITISGYDISSYAVKFATKLLTNAEISPQNYNLRVGNIIEGIEEPDASTDFATLAEVIEHIPNPQEGIKEISRIIKQGGYLYLTTVIDSNHMDHVSNFDSPQTVENMLVKEKFKIIKKGIYHMIDDFPNSNDKSIGLAYIAKKE